MEKHGYIKEYNDLLEHISGVVPYFDNFDAFLQIEDMQLSSRKIQDIGGGIGFYIDMLEKAGCSNIFGIDANIHCLKHAYSRIKTNNLLLSSGEKLPFRSNEFDVIFLSDVIEHLAGPEFALNELSSSKKGGEANFDNS